MKQRIISGAVLVAIALASILVGGPLLAGVLLFASFVGMFEMLRALQIVTSEKKFPPMPVAAAAGTAVYYLLLIFFGSRFYGEMAALTVIAVMAVYVLTFPKYRSEEAIGTIFSFIYIPFMLSFIYLTRISEGGIVHVWLVFLSSWVADTAAYFVGVKFGRHKMTPVLSPKKSWEGAAGGIAGAAAAGLIFAAIFDRGLLVQYPIVCALGAVISMCGDLAASAIKREKGIKDYGTLIPGHGGIMDRFDSVIFTAPIIYFLTQILV